MIAKKLLPSEFYLRVTWLKFKLLLPLVLFLAILFALPSLAQEEEAGGLDLTVSPPVIELVAKPGEIVIEKFRVRNNLTEPVVLQIDARRLISDPTEGNPIPENEPTGEELSWVTFDRPEFTANPREWQDITFTIDIPEDAAYGYYYVFRIKPKDDAAIETTGATVKGELLVVTLLNVMKEGALADSKLVSFSAKNMVNEYLPVDFTVKLENQGNIHVKPRGNIFITRGGGSEIGILEVNPGIGSILPGGTREFESHWNDGFLVNEPVMENGEVVLDELGNPVTKLKINWNKLTSFRIGPYEAKLLMVYDDGEKDVTIEGVTTFWVLPYKAIAVILIILVLIIVALRFFLKWYVGQAVKKSRK
jgi:hypothetical protein